MVIKKLLKEDKNFLEGLNVFKGEVTYKAVAETFGYNFTSAYASNLKFKCLF